MWTVTNIQIVVQIKPKLINLFNLASVMINIGIIRIKFSGCCKVAKAELRILAGVLQHQNSTSHKQCKKCKFINANLGVCQMEILMSDENTNVLQIYRVIFLTGTPLKITSFSGK